MSLRRDTLYNLVGNGVPLLAAVVAIPYLLKQLGAEKFGVLTLVWGLIGYFGLFDFGVGRALTYEVSKRSKDHGLSQESISAVIKAGLVITIVTGIVGALIVYLIIAPHSGSLFKISPADRAGAEMAFGITALGIIPTTLTSGLRGALEGFKRFGDSSVNRLILGTLMFVVPALVILVKGGDLPMIALGLVLVRFALCGHAIFLLRQYLERCFDVRADDVKSLLSFGVWVTISGIISPLMVFGDRFFISAVIGAKSLSLYAIPQEGLQRLLVIPAALTAALLPRMVATLERDKLAEIYRQSNKRIAWLMLAVLLGCVVFSKPVLTIWISKDFYEGAKLIVVILCVGLWFNSLSQIPLTLLHATGRPKLAAISHMIEVPIYILMIVVLSQKFGILGAAIAWSARVIIDFLIFNWFARTVLK